MAEKGSKKTKPKHPKAEAAPSVLGSLPSSRPDRLGRPRRDASTATATAPPRSSARKSAPAAAATAPPRSSARKPSGAHRPAAVRAGARPLQGRPRAAERPPSRHVSRPHGTELVSTAIQAAGELAQIGLTVGGQVLKRAVDRLPRR